jgi:YcxB-like protein
MKLAFDVSERDMLAFSERYHRASRTHNRARQSARLLLPMMLLPVMLLFFLNFGFSPAPIVILVMAMIGWYVYYPMRFDKCVRNQVRKQMCESSYSNMFGAYEITLDEDSLKSSSPTGEARYNWDAVDRVELTDDYLFVFLSGPMGYPVSIDQIGANAAHEAFEEMNRLCNATSASGRLRS